MKIIIIKKKHFGKYFIFSSISEVTSNVTWDMCQIENPEKLCQSAFHSLLQYDAERDEEALAKTLNRIYVS